MFCPHLKSFKNCKKNLRGDLVVDLFRHQNTPLYDQNTKKISEWTWLLTFLGTKTLNCTIKIQKNFFAKKCGKTDNVAVN